MNEELQEAIVSGACIDVEMASANIAHAISNLEGVDLTPDQRVVLRRYLDDLTDYAAELRQRLDG